MVPLAAQHNICRHTASQAPPNSVLQPENMTLGTPNAKFCLLGVEPCMARKCSVLSRLPACVLPLLLTRAVKSAKFAWIFPGVKITSEPFAEVALRLRGFQVSQMLHVAAELQLADRVGDASRTVAELAAESGANPNMLLRLCRALAAFGIFSVDDASRVTQTPQTSCLRSDATPTLHYAARYWGQPSNWATSPNRALRSKARSTNASM